MTIVASVREEHAEACRQQLRQIIHNVENLDLRMVRPVEPPSVTYSDVLMREVSALNRDLQQIQEIVNISTLAVCTGVAFGAAVIAALTDIRPEAIISLSGVAAAGVVGLWACITVHLRKL